MMISENLTTAKAKTSGSDDPFHNNYPQGHKTKNKSAFLKVRLFQRCKIKRALYVHKVCRHARVL